MARCYLHKASGTLAGGEMRPAIPVTSVDILRRFVEHSNAIEDLTLPPYGPGTPEYDWHLATAEWVARTGSTDYVSIRSRLSGGAPVGIRTGDIEDVMVNAHVAPRPGIPLRTALDVLDETLRRQSPTADGAEYAMRIHDLFVLAHPFMDGNGRTARLLVNAVRLRSGLPWLIFDVGQRRAYHRRLDELTASNWQRVDAEED